MARTGSSLENELLLGPRKSPALAAALQVSQPTLARMLKSPDSRVRSFGQRRSTLYALPRAIGQEGSDFPLFQVKEDGTVIELGQLTSVFDRGFVLERAGAVPATYSGIPFFLSDHRPQGFLGRAFSQVHSDLELPRRLTDWSEDQVWLALIRRGEDIGGDLLVGRESFMRHMEWRKRATLLTDQDPAKSYMEMASASDTGVVPGSSAGGEQPKFTVRVRRDQTFLSLVVKYSPTLSSARGRRWADLLVAEELASTAIAETKPEEERISMAPARALQDDRAFLESVRFDRVGEWGRRGVISFGTLVHETTGSPSNWARSAVELERQRVLSPEDAHAIRWLEAFGRLIANSDRHYGNLSFFSDALTSDFSQRAQRPRLAPVYDMLPMLFAPKDAEVDEFPRELPDLTPSAETLSVWGSARTVALDYWQRVIDDRRVSEDFKTEASRMLRAVKESGISVQN